MGYLIILIVAGILIKLAFDRGRKYGISEGYVKRISEKLN